MVDIDFRIYCGRCGDLVSHECDDADARAERGDGEGVCELCTDEGGHGNYAHIGIFNGEYCPCARDCRCCFPV